MTNMILSGCCGKMGQVITRLAEEAGDPRIVCGFDVSGASGSYPIFSEPADFTGEADVIVDFSHPSAFERLTVYAYERKIPLVMCTTGLSHGQREQLEALSHSVPVFFSANMSLGVNLLIELVQTAAKLLYKNFDIEIIEKHHNKKIDAPSGTALAIADAISDCLPVEFEYMLDRHSQRRSRDKNEIGLHSVRGGTIVGDHSVLFAGQDEIIEISHHAASKEIFAAGALRAAQFMHGKPAGMYTMRDLVQSVAGEQNL